MDLSVVIPGKNESKQIDRLFADLIPILESLDFTWEILFVNDGSTDDSLEQLLARRKADKRIAIIDLSRNFGKEAALTAGLHHASGRAVITMDADGQHNPTYIPEFVRHWQEGFDMVMAQKINRRHDGWLRSIAAHLFYRLFNWVGDISLVPHAGDFRLFDRKVVEAYKMYGERNRFNKGLFALLGFKQKVIQHDSEQGKEVRPTQWGWKKLFVLAFDALFSFSKLPLQLWLLGGVVAILASIGFLIYIITGILVFGRDVPGYASLLTVVVLMGGVNMVGIGVLGEYIHRIFTETKQRPLYLIQKIYRDDDK